MHLDPISRYREYLKSYYNNFTLQDDKLSIAPCNQFVNLSLVRKEEPSSSKLTHDGVKPNIPLEIDDLVSPDSQLILVEGPPGIGKSTLCWELCRKWDTLKSLQCYQIVLQLKLREGRVQNATKLNELFFHHDEELCQSVVKEMYRCEGEGVLLILDGFDEMPESVRADNDRLIMQLIKGVCLPKTVRLLTSRPQFSQIAAFLTYISA